MVDYGDGIVRAKVHSWLDGMEVFGFGISRAPKTVKSLVSAMNLDLASVDYFLFHQANKMMNDRIVSKLGIPDEKAPSNLKDFGNTSCASIPLLFATELRKGTPFGGRMVLCGFGVGLSWATVFVECQNLHISELIEI
jgi:3-oxoacyl-[acyl-carrier-protein] synthase-3